MSGHRGAPAPSPPLPGDPGAGAPRRVSAEFALIVDDHAGRSGRSDHPLDTLTSHADTAALPGP